MDKILCITHKYPPTIGGMEKQSYELIKRLEKEYDVIKIVYTEHDGNKLKWFLGLKNKIKTTLAHHPDIRLIHLNDGLMAALCIWLPRFTDIPVVATYHGLDITFPLSYFQKRIVPKMHKYSGGIAVSQATAHQCVQRGFEESKIYTVPNGVDHDLSDIPTNAEIIKEIGTKIGRDVSNKKIVITMGRSVKRKGFSWFVKNVVPSLSDDTIFLMAGPFSHKPSIAEKIISILPQRWGHMISLLLGFPSDEKELRSILKTEELKNKVAHVGKLSFTQLMQLISQADVFVMPNIKVEGDSEGFGLVALEASLRGTPVVAANIEGITDAIKDGKNGYLLPSQDAESWIEKINFLLHDEATLTQMSAKTRQYTKENYSWDTMTKGYVEVFDKIINQQKPHHHPSSIKKSDRVTLG